MAGRKANTFPIVDPSSAAFVLGYDLTKSDALRNERYDMIKIGRTGDNIFEIFSEADFPIPVGDIINLPSGRYILKKSLVTANRFKVESLARVTIESDDQNNISLEYTGSGTLFTDSPGASLSVSNLPIILSGNTAQLFLFTGGGGLFFDTISATATGTGITIGVVAAFAFAIEGSTFDGFADAQILISNPSIVVLRTSRWLNGGGSNPILSFSGSFPVTASIDIESCLFFTSINESVIFIPSSFEGPTAGTITIDSGTNNLGIGNYYGAGSLTQASPIVNVNRCTGSPDSMVSCEAHQISILTPDVVAIVTQDVAVPFADSLPVFTPGIFERVTINSVGVVTYTGKTPIDLLVHFTALMEKVGGGATDIGVGLFKNGVLITNFVYAHSVNAGVIKISDARIIPLVENDTFELAFINFDGTANISVSQADLIVSRVL